MLQCMPLQTNNLILYHFFCSTLLLFSLFKLIFIINPKIEFDIELKSVIIKLMHLCFPYQHIAKSGLLIFTFGHTISQSQLTNKSAFGMVLIQKKKKKKIIWCGDL